LKDRVSLGAAFFFALLAVTLVMAVLVVRARTPDLMLEVTRQPSTLTADDARISFFVRESDEHARVAIVDSHEDIVRTLDGDVELDADEEVSYDWEGSTDAGTPAPPGRYRLEVALPSQDREMVWPRRITLVPGVDSGDES
jgi:hypothetical protein